MRNIVKRTEPQSLAQHRMADPTDYEGYRDKDRLRGELVSEQRGICCYCMGRIHAAIGSTKIEHWQSQANYPDQRLVYSNLLGACPGGEGSSVKHCDSFKGNRDLSRNPANRVHDVEAIVRFLPDGRITSCDPIFATELESVLNLNAQVLISFRKEALRAFLRTLRIKGTLTQQTWERWLGRLNGEAHHGDLAPYCQVVVYWIRKKLARNAR